MIQKRFSQMLSLASALVLGASLAFGQAMDGNLVGVVSDKTGALVAGATVEITNQATNQKVTAKSASDGTYRFANLALGRYKLTVTQTGFTAATTANIPVELNRQSTINVTLEVGNVATTVEVVEAAATIDTTTSNVVQNFTAMQAIQLPVSATGALGVINLSLLGSGVTTQGGVGYGTGPSVGGQRPTNNNFMVEGIDVNNRSVTGPVLAISNEAIQDFSLQQNQFSSEFGHSTGGQFNSVIKSGTNGMHGALFEYFQNRNLNAVDESLRRQGITSNPRYDNNRFGGNFGGPVIKDKWFYFGNLEYNPQGVAGSPSGAVFIPTQAGISALEANPQVSRRNLEQFRKWVPVAGAQDGTRSVQVAGSAIPIGIFRSVAPSYQNDLQYTVSSDYNLTQTDIFRARYAYGRTSSINTTSVTLPEFFTPTKSTRHIANFTYLKTLSSSVTNETRAGYSRIAQAFPIGNQQWPGLDVFPNVTMLDLGMQIGPNGNYPQSYTANTIQLVNNTSWYRGKHTVKFGYDGRKINGSNFFVQRLRGDYVYNTLDRFMRDITPEFGQRSAGGFPFVANLLSHYLYATDEWRLRSNLVLTLGIRYEYVGVPAGAQSQQLNSLASVPGLLQIGAPQNRKNEFAPRIGLAWSPGRDGRTSIRAGFGMGYDQVYQNLGVNSLPPQYFTTIDGHIERPDQPNFLGQGGVRAESRPITDPAVARRLTSSFIPRQDRPYSLQWNFSAQRVFRKDYTVEARYLGTRGLRLPIQIQMNRPASVTSSAQQLPTFNERPTAAQLDALPVTLANFPLSTGNPANAFQTAGFTSTITSFQQWGQSSYHGLALQLNKRFSNGLTYIASYTWSHNIDDSTAALFSTVTTPRRPQDFNNLKPERASSALDHRHRFTLAPVYESQWLKGSNNWFTKNLLGNWVMAGVLTFQTGSWATIRSAQDANRNGDNAGDRTIFNPAGAENSGSSVTPLCRSSVAACGFGNAATVGYLVNNPSARYIVAGPGTFPNAGRNTVRMPMINNLDLNIGKRFDITERFKLQIRADFYNVTNTPQFVPGFPNVANNRARTGASETSMLIAGNPIFLRPDLAFQSNARTGAIVLRLMF